MKIVKYPAFVENIASDQGVGPHYDAGFLTFVCGFYPCNLYTGAHNLIRRQLLQASSHPGLQVQNLSGQWIDAPPIPGTFVVNIGKGKFTSLHVGFVNGISSSA